MPIKHDLSLSKLKSRGFAENACVRGLPVIGRPITRISCSCSCRGLIFSWLTLIQSVNELAIGQELLLDEAITLFKRLGIDVRSISAKEFTSSYFALAKRYHPDRGNQKTHELMANINAARTAILKTRRLG